MAERPIPFSIVVCTLIAEYSDPSSAIHKSPKLRAAGIDRNSIADDDNFTTEIEEHLSQVIKSIIVHNDSMTLTQLLSLISGKHCRFFHAAEILLNFLNQSCESIDALVDLFTALRSAVARGMIDGDSAHGVYIRKRCLGFDELAFGSVARLWESFCDYIYDANDWPKNQRSKQNTLEEEQTMIIDDKGKCSDEEGEGDESLMVKDICHWPLAPRQISRKLFEQCLNLQKEIGCTSYEAVEAEIQEILMENPELTLAHFLRFLNDAMHGERVGAIESFHRYFDYAMIQERKFRLSNAPLPNDVLNSNINSNNMNGRDNEAKDNHAVHYDNVAHYSAIILSSLYHRFVNYELAYMATREAIRIAHQTGDEACLAYALGWLHASSDNNSNLSSVDASGSSGYQLLSRTSSRAAKFNIRSLIVGSSLMRANQISMGSDNDFALRGIRHPICFLPAQAWETISTASTENALTSMMGTTAYRHDIPSHWADQAGSDEVLTTFAQQHFASAGLWQCMGQTSLASTSFQTTMRCYSNYLSSEQSSIVAKEIAYSALYGAGSDKTYFNQESPTQSLCSALERLRLTVPTIQPTSMYQNALQKLRASWAGRSLDAEVEWCHSAIMLLHESCIQKCDLYNAVALNVLLHSCAPLVHREYAKTSVDILGQTCLLLCRQHRWESAKSIISDQIIPICEINRFRTYHAHYLLQLAIIHFDSTPYDPIRALMPILSCLSICEKFSIDGIHAVALTLLARAHFEMGYWSKSKSILNAAMPVIIQNTHVCFQGEAYLCMAKVILSEIRGLKVNDMSHLDRKKNRLFRAALSQLQKAQVAFEKAVDVVRLREVYYLLAHCHACLPGHTSRRNMSAKKFQEMNSIKLQYQVPSWHDAIDIVKGNSDS